MGCVCKSVWPHACHLLLWAHIHNFHIFQQTNCPVGRDNAYYLRTAITMMMILTASSFFMIFIITVLLLNVCALITSWIFSEVIIPWLTWQSLVSKDHNAHFYSNHLEKGQIKNLYSSNWTKQKQHLIQPGAAGYCLTLLRCLTYFQFQNAVSWWALISWGWFFNFIGQVVVVNETTDLIRITLNNYLRLLDFLNYHSRDWFWTLIANSS